MEFWQIAHAVAQGIIHEYDMWDMALYGKKTPLVEQ